MFRRIKLEFLIVLTDSVEIVDLLLFETMELTFCNTSRNLLIFSLTLVIEGWAAAHLPIELAFSSVRL